MFFIRQPEEKYTDFRDFLKLAWFLQRLPWVNRKADIPNTGAALSLKTKKEGGGPVENVSYIGLSQQVALHQQMNASANNLANMNTTGFKSQRVIFLEYLNKSQGKQEGVRQVSDFASYRDTSTGTMRQTFNDLDVALQSDGFFAVTTNTGTRYTRDGSFALNQNREIVTQTGYRVQDESGAPIVIPPEARKININSDGTISTETGPVGRLKVVSFENPQALNERGDNLYSAPVTLAETPVEAPRIVQGALESSNVNPILEVNRMVEILRSYQATQRMLMTDHERIRSTIQKLTRV